MCECNKTYEMKILATQSKLANKMLENGYCYEVLDVISFDAHRDCDVVNNPFGGDYFSFHPNGNCGCILCDDSYCFGIRCNHLMWCEGFCEDEPDPYDGAKPPTSILVYGNHKGYFYIKLIVFKKECDEKNTTHDT